MCCAQCVSDCPFFGDIVRLRWRRGVTARQSAGPESISKDGTYELKIVPDVLGLHARQLGVSVVKVLLGCDSRSVRALVLDVKVLDRGFHNVTLLDMGDITGPDVSIADLSLLRLQWSVPVVSGIAWPVCSPSWKKCAMRARSVIVELRWTCVPFVGRR